MEGQFFRGEQTVRLDGKGRIGLPVDWRPLLQGDGRAVFHAHPCLKEKALRCMSTSRLAKMAASVQNLPAYDPKRQLIEGLIISRAKDHNLDGQGRTVLHAGLLDEVGIGDEMVLIGATDHFQIWDADTLRAHRAKLLDELRAGEHQGIEDLHI